MVIFLSLFIQDKMAKEMIANIGFFALSGALTNWIAVHMLFERVPLFYGSGIIQSRFEELKEAIKTLVQEQFFTEEYLTLLVEQQKGSFLVHAPKLADAIHNYAMYQGLVDAIMNSSFGSMLQMVGGEKALLPIRPKFEEKMKETITEHLGNKAFQERLTQTIDTKDLTQSLGRQLESIVDDRLNEMTPQMVKTLMKDIMHRHLGWLVVWGGVFGGALGLLKSLSVYL